MRIRFRPWLLLIALIASTAPIARGQEVEVERPAPKPVEDFEVDEDSDGVPDGWYNLRDAKIASPGRAGGSSHCLRFENARPGRPARASRAFGVDGRKVEAVVVGCWLRAENLGNGERLGDDPGLVIDFLGDQLRAVRRGMLGPWKTLGPTWTRVARKIPIPPGTRDAILSLGLIGATGVLEVDDLTIDFIPVGGRSTTNLVLNGDFELGDPEPAHWLVDRARRAFPGHESASAIELKAANAKAYTGLGLPASRFQSLEVSAFARAQGLRANVTAGGFVYFLDEDGRAVRDLNGGAPVLPFAGSFDWQEVRATVPVPPGATRALLQFEKANAFGTLEVDDVKIVGVGGDPEWTPDHVATDTAGWLPIGPSPSILAGSGLDASTLLEAPAGRRGFVGVKEGRFHFADGTRARFFGVVVLPPAAYPDAASAEALADRLARSGANLARLVDLDAPLGPARSLFDDARDDTKALDPEALARLDHLVAALKKRGVYVAIDLQSGRKFRAGDDIAGARFLPAGGGPAAAFDPSVREAALRAAEALLSHVNPETGLALRDDPALAWITLAGELSLFDLPEMAEKDYKSAVDAVRNLMRKDEVSNVRRDWQTAESDQWKALAEGLRKIGVKVPIAGCSHSRRDSDFDAAQAAPGLDFLDDRLYYMPPGWAGPGRRSPLWYQREVGLPAFAARKRKADRPYVAGQYASPTFGTWATPSEGADLLFVASLAASDDWDGLVRRGVFLFPKIWYQSAAGTGGGEDIFQLPEVLNGTPQAAALLPHAASVVLRGGEAIKATKRAGRAAPKGVVHGWSPRDGRIVIDSTHTQGLAGWLGVASAKSEEMTIEVDAPLGVVVASSLDREPIATAKRLLVTAVGRVEPTGFRFADEWRRERADPGVPPLLHDGPRARVEWHRAGTVKAFALDNTGARVAPATVEKTAEGWRLVIDGRTPSLHWEMVAD